MEKETVSDEVKFEPPLDIFHVSGGISLLLGSNRSAALFFPGQHYIPVFCPLPRSPIFDLLRDQEGLKILGRNRYETAQAMHEIVSDNFVIAAPDQSNKCLAFSQHQNWSGISNTLHRLKNDSAARLASRLSSQIALVRHRFERLSLAYRFTIIYEFENDDPASSESFVGNRYSHYIASEYRSCLNEMYALRDAVLGCAHYLVFEMTEPYGIKKIRRLCASHESGTASALRASMFSEDEFGDNLISEMSLYRNVALHCTGSTNPLFNDVYTVRYSHGPLGTIPYLVFPLYDDLKRLRDLEKGASNGFFERPEEKELLRFFQLQSHRDALEFCFQCFVRLLRISQTIGQECGVEPEVIHLTEKDITQAEIRNADGSVDRYRREVSTGKLKKH